MRLAHVFGLVFLGCSSTTIIYEGPEASSDSATAMDGSNDSGVKGDVTDAKDENANVDATSDTGVDSSMCVNGTTACVDVWAMFCSRLKSCCNGNCPNVWQNQPNQNDCENHFLGAPSATYCQQQRSSDMRCEQPCLGDVQIGSCNTVINASYQNGVPSSGMTCLAFWQ